MWYIKEDYTWRDVPVTLGQMFTRPWLAMLALGAIGHQLHLPVLFLNYWTVWLVLFVSRMFFGSNIFGKYKAAQTRQELK